MNSLVCFDKIFLLLVILIIALLSINHYFYYNKKITELTNEAQMCKSNIPQEKGIPTIINSQGEPQPVYTPPVSTDTSIPVQVVARPNMPNLVPTVDVIKNYDYKNLLDPFTEPARRPPREIIGPIIGSPYFNFPTQGFPDNYSLYGYLVNDDVNDENKIIRLFGRQKYPGSVEYEYYVEINQGAVDKLKYKLEKQNRELYDDDHVYVDIIKRNYKVKLMKQLGLEYNPFLL